MRAEVNFGIGIGPVLGPGSADVWAGSEVSTY